MYRSSVTVVNAKITNFSFPEGQIKEECNLNKFFQYIKSIGPHNDAKIQYELENSLDFYSQDSNNPSAFNCTLKAFSYASKSCFCNGAGKNFVDTLFGDILEALDITRAEMFVSLAVTNRKFEFRLGVECRTLIQPTMWKNDQNPKVGHKRNIMSNLSEEPQKKKS